MESDRNDVGSRHSCAASLEDLSRGYAEAEMERARAEIARLRSEVVWMHLEMRRCGYRFPRSVVLVPAADGTAEQTVEGVAEKIERLEAELKDRDETIGRLCDDAWGHVYPGMTDWDYPDQAIRHLRQYADELKADKDSAYEERSRIVAAFARTVHVLCGWPVVVTRTAIAGWGPEWHGCVYITTPAGQVSWHFHDDHAPLFDGLPRAVHAEWDGHDTAEKYRRLDRLPGR